MLKKLRFTEDEISIFDDAIISKRGGYWHFRMWLNGEGKYARKSLRTKNRTTAIEKGKEAYLDIHANLKAGKTYFSITAKEGVEKYLKHREKDVQNGLIVSGRHGTIRTHLQHWLDFIGSDTKLKELERTDCEEYFAERVKASNGRAKQITVQNEQSTINACIKWLFKNHETHVDSFDFRKLPTLHRDTRAVQEATISADEYARMCQVMRSYCAKTNKGVDEHELLVRQIVRHHILIAANSGLRVGEQRQLRWNDVEVLHEKSPNGKKTFAKIHVRAETSKRRKSRIFICRNGEYFERLREITKPTSNGALIFSVDGEQFLSERTLLSHFHAITDLAGIERRKERRIVPYTLRHFMITQRIMSGLDFIQTADMCGTSASEIENTYYHLNDARMLTSAKADYRRLADGTIETY